jgi:hypothetical protein
MDKQPIVKSRTTIYMPPEGKMARAVGIIDRDAGESISGRLHVIADRHLEILRRARIEQWWRSQCHQSNATDAED